jgi:hypothetical protein
MKGRCSNPKNVRFKDYGGRGIYVCDRWQFYENFLADMGERPKGKSLDRIDNDGPYSPDNCRWATPIQQMRNKRNNIMVLYGGRTMPLPEAAELAGIPLNIVKARNHYGWPRERWFIPIGSYRREMDRDEKGQWKGADHTATVTADVGE